MKADTTEGQLASFLSSAGPLCVGDLIASLTASVSCKILPVKEGYSHVFGFVEYGALR